MESNRSWSLEWDGLDVLVQKTVTVKGRWKHPRGFRESTEVHFPLDTISQLRRFSPDVVISTEMGFRSLSALLFTKLRRHCSLILWTEVNESTEHGRGRARGIVRKILARHCDGFLALGDAGVEYVHSLGAPSERIFKLLYTTDVSRFGAYGAERESQRRLLYVGQLIERKGLLQFTAALGKWAEEHPDRNVELVFAGDGPLRERLQSSPVPSNLRLQFLGNVSYHDLPRVYAQAGVLALPTLADTWGVVVNEAMAAGLPVLGSVHSQAVKELVTHGKDGWTFSAGNPDEMDGAINECLTTPLPVLRQMRQKARQTAMKLPPACVAGMIQAAIESCLENSAEAQICKAAV